MSFWTAIVLIVAIVFVTQFLREKRNATSGHTSGADRDPALHAAREQQLEGEIADLKERIKVLERIAYDDRKRLGLADEIESLRD
ncbi:hypothetical protein EKN06_14860 [Croceicoccus ponticola]|uniref:Envelope stress response membrane protein PspB n=1 Tax=Croceicoccus ponticola TaxID=2217664 RepID=A0A437GU79_9SPHN|nr:hypothetical protein [Croceicoccus ponticola]RVQ64872.1 hypothetical protein EKN06_14860 [Croceicoccus ponticola]